MQNREINEYKEYNEYRGILNLSKFTKLIILTIFKKLRYTLSA